MKQIIQYLLRECDGELWIDGLVNGNLHASIGPFDTEAERQRACDDLLSMMRSLGAEDFKLQS